MTSSKTRVTVSAVLCAIVAVSIQGQSQLTSGTGPGSVTLKVDGWGMWGGCPQNQAAHSDAMYTTSAGAGPFPTTCYSAVLLEDLTGCAAPGRTLLALSDALYGQFPAQAVNPAVNVLNPGRHIQTVAPQVVCGLQISVDQRLDGPDPASGSFESSTLVQTYTITNTGATPRVFKLIRFIDADLSAAFTGNRGGASRRLADCGLATPPFVSNNEWLFEFDPFSTPGVLVAVAAEGVDVNGQPIQTAAYRVNSSPVGHPNPTFVSNPSGFLTNVVDNDLNVDLVAATPELTGDFAMLQSLNHSVPPGGTVSSVFRTRWTSLDAASATNIELQARDITCSAWNGNNSSVGIGPLLCINGQGQCAPVAPGVGFNISLASPAAGPSPADYLVFGTFGQPILGTACGSPQAGDAALWGPPFGIIGMGAFPVSSSLATWTGGGAAVGIPLISSVPGIALITGPQATAAMGSCGGSIIVSVPGLPSGLSVTLQGAIFDGGGAPLYVTLTNAVNIVIGCPCQTH